MKAPAIGKTRAFGSAVDIRGVGVDVGVGVEGTCGIVKAGVGVDLVVGGGG